MILVIDEPHATVQHIPQFVRDKHMMSLVMSAMCFGVIGCQHMPVLNYSRMLVDVLQLIGRSMD